MRIGVDLLWVRPGVCGGTESYIRNLLDGFAAYGRENEYVLFAACDNAYSFRKYARVPHMRVQACRVESGRRAGRIIWENLHLDAAAGRCCVDLMFVPVYSKPASYAGGIPYVSVIHDFQALHYPEYFTAAKRWFLKYSWKRTIQTSARVAVISDAVKKDLSGYCPGASEKAAVIYNPVITRRSGLPAEAVERRYGIRRMEYFYCVSSMLPHKNLDTVLRAVRGLPGTCLVVSGVGGQEQRMRRKLHEYRIAERVVLTGFVPDRVRDCLYENCRLFLFPSVFEGFGMPPVEAMRRGKRAVVARCSCLEEVTQGRAVYVEDPYSAREWKEKIQYAMTLPEEKIPFREYELQEIVRQYETFFSSVRPEKKHEKAPEGETQKRVYGKIYDMVSENYRKAGKELDYKKAAFLCNIGMHPQIVDVAEYKKLSNPEFYQAVYTAVYQRLPEQEEYKKWSACLSMEADRFQKKLLKKLSASSAAGINKIRFIHNPYFRQHRGIRYKMLGMLYGLTDKPVLRQLGKKLPGPVQKAARKVLL